MKSRSVSSWLRTKIKPISRPTVWVRAKYLSAIKNEPFYNKSHFSAMKFVIDIFLFSFSFKNSIYIKRKRIKCKHISFIHTIMRWIHLFIILLHLFSIFILSKTDSTLKQSKRFLFSSSSCKRMHRSCEYHSDCCPPLRCSFIDATCQPR